MTSAQRQRAYKAQREAAGLVQCNVWIPAGAFDDLRLLAEKLRADPNLTVGPIRNNRTGKLMPLRSK